MKIMLIEDDKTKSAAIAQYMETKNVPRDNIIVAESMTDFAANLSADIGLFIIDIRIPSIDDVPASQNGPAILEAIVKAGKNDALLLAISSYAEDFPSLRPLFEKYGCILTDYSQTKAWQSTLDHYLVQLKKNVKFDFIILCALSKERNPYVALVPGGKRVVRGNIECYDIAIDGKRGTVVLLPKMGLVNAAITAGVCIDRYKPTVVCMSGICGGFKSRAEIGQLVISEMVYEYQSGKWATDGFLQEPYQVATDQSTLTALRLLASEANLVADLEAGFQGTRPSEQHAPLPAVFTSGSAVIADQQFMQQVEMIHRKVHAVDMEVFAIQRAAQLAAHNPVCICAKTIVDLGDSEKSDSLHDYGSFISAKFILKALQSVFMARDTET